MPLSGRVAVDGVVCETFEVPLERGARPEGAESTIRDVLQADAGSLTQRLETRRRLGLTALDEPKTSRRTSLVF